MIKTMIKICITIICATLLFVIVLYFRNAYLSSKEIYKYLPPGILIDIEGKRLHLSINGNGKDKIVLLSGFGTPCPFIDFKPLIKRLENEFMVITIDNFGYGWSDLTDCARTNSNIVEEIRLALKKAGIQPPYTIVPHSISGLYSLFYANKYPDEIRAVVGIDISVPDQFKCTPKEKIPEYLGLIRRLGVLRFLIDISPSLINDFMKNIGKDDKDILKAMICRNAINRTVINEYKSMDANAETLSNMFYPNKIDVALIVSSFNEDNSKREGWKKSWVLLHKELISNDASDTLIYMNGNHYLHHDNADKIAVIIKETISKSKQ